MRVLVGGGDNNDDRNVLIERGRCRDWCCLLCIDWSGVISRPAPLSYIIESWLRMWNSETLSLIGFIKVIIWYHYSSLAWPATSLPQPATKPPASQFGLTPHSSSVYKVGLFIDISSFVLSLFDRKTTVTVIEKLSVSVKPLLDGG